MLAGRPIIITELQIIIVPLQCKCRTEALFSLYIVKTFLCETVFTIINNDVKAFLIFLSLIACYWKIYRSLRWCGDKGILINMN